MNNNIPPNIKQQRGAILIFLSLMIMILLGFGAFTVDYGHVYIIKAELQNAADSSALAGAGYLYPTTSSGAPNWTLAQTNATSMAIKNKVDQRTISNSTVATGYYNLTGTPTGVHPVTPPAVPSINEAAGVMVTISKSAGINGGPVPLFFGALFGLTSVDVSAQAIAVTGSPAYVYKNTLFPVVVTSSVYDLYWDKVNGKPKIDPKTGQPYVFKIDNSGTNGNWTAFGTDVNDVPSVRDLITNGNPGALGINDKVWVEPGVKNTIYTSVPTNVDVVVAIIQDGTSHSQQPILAFGALHIYAAKGGSSKWIEASFTSNIKIEDANPGGAFYGAYTPARLAK